MHFVDRLFLTWYSPEALAAGMPAGILNYAIACIFIGTAGYVSTFVAQYTGANRNHAIGPVLWQGLYISVIGGIVLGLMAPFASAFFKTIGHGETLRPLETVYFQVLCIGVAPAVASAALSGFFSGLGKTVPIMWVNIVINIVHIALDYALIFGKWGSPEMGIRGAAIASVASTFIGFILFAVMIFNRGNEARFRVLTGWRPDARIFSKLLKYGLPSSMQIFLDVGGFAAFVLLVGRLGPTELAASNLAFNINSFAFLPMLGIGTAVSVLVGRYLGADNDRLAARSVWSAFQITLLYMCSVAFAYITIPQVFFIPHAMKADPATFPAVSALAILLLRFVAFFSIFDTLNIIFGSALRGAGDTRFVMMMLAVVSIFGLVLPTWFAVVVLQKGIFTAWFIISGYCVLLGFSFLVRFLTGKWRSMRVIEETLPILSPMAPETATNEF